jgi:transaldolase
MHFMRIFVDSADIQQIRESFSWGIVDGLTTNPSLIKQAFEKYGGTAEAPTMEDYVKRICETAGEHPVSLEVIGPSEKDMTSQGHFLFETFNSVAGNVVIKIPVCPNLSPGAEGAYDGLKAIKSLATAGIPVNTTLVFTVEQALLAAKAGAAYVSPFAGRIDDLLRKELGMDFGKTDYFPAEGMRESDGKLKITDNGTYSGVHLVDEIVRAFEIQDISCLVLAASLRNPRQVRECALAGAQVSTIPFGVIQEMVDHRKTIEGMQAFLNDVVPEYRDLFASG